MKYKILSARGEPATIYILPVSSDSAAYRIIYPDGLEKDLLEILLEDGILIQEFEGCSELAVSEIREYLAEKLEQSSVDYNRNINYTFAGGVTLGVLGIINWAWPDPLPFVDEALLIVAGTALALFALSRRGQLAQYRDRVARAEKKIQELEASAQPVLTRLFQSIRTKEKPDTGDGNQPPFPDRIDLESQWLVRYIDVHEMIESGFATEAQVKGITTSLCDIIPLRALVKMEKHSDRDAVRRRMKRLKERITERIGISNSVLSVYCEFYKSAQDYFEGSGKGL